MDDAQLVSFCKSYIAEGVEAITVFMFDNQSYDPDLLINVCFTLKSYMTFDYCVVEDGDDKVYNKYSLYRTCSKRINGELESLGSQTLIVLCFASPS